MVTVIWNSFLLRSVDVALEIEADVGGRTAFAGHPAPHAVVVFLQIGDAGVTGFLDLGFGLAFSKAVAAGHRRVRIVLSRTIDRVVVRARLRWRVLCRRSTR